MVWSATRSAPRLAAPAHQARRSGGAGRGPARPVRRSAALVMGRRERRYAVAAKPAWPAPRSAASVRFPAGRRSAAPARFRAGLLSAARAKGRPDRLSAASVRFPAGLRSTVPARFRAGRRSAAAARDRAGRPSGALVMGLPERRPGPAARPGLPSTAAGPGPASPCWPAPGRRFGRRGSGRTPGFLAARPSARPSGGRCPARPRGSGRGPLRAPPGGRAAVPGELRRPRGIGRPAASARIRQAGQVPLGPALAAVRMHRGPAGRPLDRLADRQPAYWGPAMIPASRRRLAVLHVVVAALLIGLGVRVWNVQIASGASYASQASQDQARDVIVPAVRGEILDDSGQPLVDNRSTLVIAVNMAELSQQQDGGTAVLTRLAGLLGMPLKVLRNKVRLCTAGVSQPCWQGSPYQPIPVAENVSD